jgi:hypothetical protein
MRPRSLIVLALALAAGGCSGAPQGTAEARGSGRARTPAPDPVRLGDDRVVRVSELSERDRQEFDQAWRHFVSDHPRWPVTIRNWLAKGGAAPYLLSESLFHYFWSASAARRSDALRRTAEVASWIGEPAVAYFAKPLVTDLVPLPKPVTVEVPDPDDPRATKPKTFDAFAMDDVTRQDAARILVAIGEPAVATLASPAILRQSRPTARRFAAYALGRVGSPAAVAALADALRTQSHWQDRAAAADALGAAMDADPSARRALEAARDDPDAFVRRRVDEALAGRTRLPI